MDSFHKAKHDLLSSKKQAFSKITGITLSKTWLEQKDAEFHVPYSQECVFDKNLLLIRVRIYLDPNIDWLHHNAVQTKLSCQFRVILNDGVSLPLEKYHGKYLHVHNLRGSDEAHAYHVEPIVIIGRGNNATPEYVKDDEHLERYIRKYSTQVKITPDVIL